MSPYIYRAALNGHYFTTTNGNVGVSLRRYMEVFK